MSALSSDLRHGFRLGPWTVEPLRGSVAGPQAEASHLEPKVMDVSVQLAGRPNRLVTRGQLLDVVWGGESAADELLTRAVSEIRRALHDDPLAPRYIETVPKRGYRLIGQVHEIPGAGIGNRAGTPEARSGVRGLAAVTFLALAAGLAWFAYQEFLAGRGGEGQPVALGIGDSSIAVLPFVNMSGDPGIDYLSEGLSEEIRNLLAGVPGLKVIGRTSSHAFKDGNENLRAIGRALGVESILEGSVRGSGDRLRITAQLIDAADGTQLWSNSYDRTMSDLFELQDDVAAAIIDALRMHIEAAPTRGRPTASAEAYGLFLQARYAVNLQDNEAALENLLQAIELDPEFAEAHELLAHVYWTQFSPYFNAAEAQELTRAAAARALEIDPGLPLARALFMAGSSARYIGPDVIEAFLAGARVQPNNPLILRALTWDLAMAGYLDQALVFAERWVNVDPLSSIAHIRHCAVLRAVGRIEDSIAALVAAQSVTSGSLDWYYGELLMSQGRDAAAIGRFEDYLRQTGANDPAWVADLVTRARDQGRGHAYLDQHIPDVVHSTGAADPAELRWALERWHLLLGHIDRYFELIFENSTGDGAWSDADLHVWYGTLNRDLGFTAHPMYLEVADRMGFIDVWEQRGPPDFCRKARGEWICH